MTTKIGVLDHGFVRLVSYMQPAEPPIEGWPNLVNRGNWTGDLEIVRNARVSFNADWRAGYDIELRATDESGAVSEGRSRDPSKDEKLINYMMRNRHTSPFEAMVFTFEIKCPMFIARQWHRHRTWSYNEVSARYAELPEEFYVPSPYHIGVQSKDNKQAREIPTDLQSQHFEATAEAIRHANENSFVQYKILLRSGVPRELARSVLPLGTYTRFFGTVDLHNLFHFIRLRDHNHAQWEIQQYAKALKKLVQPICPVAVAAFEETLDA